MVFERATGYELEEERGMRRDRAERGAKGVDKREEKVSLMSYETAVPAVVWGQLSNLLIQKSSKRNPSALK